MNEIEYAITNFEEFLEADIGQGDLHMCSAETALDALREKQERDKGCKYCQQGTEIAYQAKSKHINSQDAYICLDGNILEADLFTDYMAAKINYCPMCGKRLEVEP